MKNNFTISQRNAIVENHLWCIKAVMKQNRALIRAAKLDTDDVYQQLALRLIRAVMSFDPEKGNLEQHIFAQLHFELLNWQASVPAARHDRNACGIPRERDLAGCLPYEGCRMSLRDKMLAVMADVNSARCRARRTGRTDCHCPSDAEEPVYPGRSRTGKELRDQRFPQPHHGRKAV